MDYYEEVKGGLITTNRIGSVNAPSLMQLVIKECLNERPQIEVYDQNRKMLYEHLTALGFECLKPQGAFYLFVKSPIEDYACFYRRRQETAYSDGGCLKFWMPGLCASGLLCIP